MSKEKAIEICENLTQTINKMRTPSHIEHKNEVFEIPRAKKTSLVRKRKDLMKKYNIK
tara:strand:+ start:740 stop:913 length:174 start_codon:yes stop_codon:yes gene_type:complete